MNDLERAAFLEDLRRAHFTYTDADIIFIEAAVHSDDDPAEKVRKLVEYLGDRLASAAAVHGAASSPRP
jgi:hypothetical protein